MPRRKLSEYRSKTLLTCALDLPYEGWAIDTETSPVFANSLVGQDGLYVVKVDQGVKGRFKKGLVSIETPVKDITDTLLTMGEKGYSSFIVEPYYEHSIENERYLSMVSTLDGVRLNVSMKGGVDIEKATETVSSFLIDDSIDWISISNITGIDESKLQAMITFFKDNYCTFLEINPYVVDGSELKLLDIAIEVDDAATSYVESWTVSDFRSAPRVLTDEEKTVGSLNENSPASFTLQMVNPNGSIFLLLSGGGASVVIADEVYLAGMGESLANYGEYSGNPTHEETYIYASAVLRLLLASNATSKVLYIGGAVANFTNINKTFSGIIQAIDEFSEQLRDQRVKIFVRRGGPFQKEGLAKMHSTLQKYDLLGAVNDQTVEIGDSINDALKGVSNA